MLVANSFDLWQKDSFFSAAEEVQHSADIMESAYRNWLKERREGLSPNQHSRELQMALGTAKWQLEEFEKAVRMSYNKYADEITITRHKQFVSAIENQILHVEAALRESFDVQGKKPFQWITLDEKERHDLALFLSGTSNMPQLQDSETLQMDSNGDTRDQEQGCGDAIDVNSLSRHVVGHTCADGITSAKKTCNLEIVVDDGYGQTSSIVPTPKDKGLKPFHLSRTFTRFCGIDQLLVRLAGSHRLIHSPIRFPFSCSIRFTIVLMLTIFLVVPFLLLST